jgi:ubiquinone biosynthesis accessory factor UbiJ
VNGVFEHLSARLLNHLLTGAPWATERLHQHRGCQFRLRLGQQELDFLVGNGGLLHPCVAGGAASVTIELPAQTPALALFDRGAIFQRARISGSAEFAETLGFVFRNLRWDAEHDIAQLFGDIVAHRLVQGGRRLMAAQVDGIRRLVANGAEYLVFEKRVLPLREEAGQFSQDLADLREELARLETRIARLTR